MTPLLLTLPFTRSAWVRTPHGMRERVAFFGVLRFDGATLVAEYRARRTPTSTLRTYVCAVKHVVLPLSQLAAVSLHSRTFRGPALVIETTEMGLLPDIPGGDGTRCIVHVARADADRARDLVVSLSDCLADLQLGRLARGASGVAEGEAPR